MSNEMTARNEVNGWSDLIATTRDALATLRAEDLEQLASRATILLDGALGYELMRRGTLSFSETELIEVTTEHRLLGALLAATDRNIQVLRRLRCSAGCDSSGLEVNSRWVR